MNKVDLKNPIIKVQATYFSRFFCFFFNLNGFQLNFRVVGIMVQFELMSLFFLAGKREREERERRNREKERGRERDPIIFCCEVENLELSR